ncbi:MAG: hypothetical protein HGN29_15865 [Asgard group archaeon]|nr:hypothetical protein [Asgard group archaeon]
MIDSIDIDIADNTFKNCRCGCYISNSTYNLIDNDFLENYQDTNICD